MNTPISVTLFYDEYEKNNGDGFYPVIEKSHACDTPITIKFTLDKQHKYWKQVDSYNIDGLDGNGGELLLKMFYQIEHFNCTVIVNKFGKTIHVQ